LAERRDGNLPFASRLMPLLSMMGHWLNRLLLAAKSHFGPWLKWWVLVWEGQKCLIFQWG
jgi:hypothetical protein